MCREDPLISGKRNNRGVRVRRGGIRISRRIFVMFEKEFGGGEEELVKAAELRKLEQGGKTIEEFVQEFKRAARRSGYKGQLLVEEFKRGMNSGIRRKLMEVENPRPP